MADEEKSYFPIQFNGLVAVQKFTDQLDETMAAERLELYQKGYEGNVKPYEEYLKKAAVDQLRNKPVITQTETQKTHRYHGISNNVEANQKYLENTLITITNDIDMAKAFISFLDQNTFCMDINLLQEIVLYKYSAYMVTANTPSIVENITVKRANNNEPATLTFTIKMKIPDIVDLVKGQYVISKKALGDLDIPDIADIQTTMTITRDESNNLVRSMHSELNIYYKELIFIFIEPLINIEYLGFDNKIISLWSKYNLELSRISCLMPKMDVDDTDTFNEILEQHLQLQKTSYTSEQLSEFTQQRLENRALYTAVSNIVIEVFTQYYQEKKVDDMNLLMNTYPEIDWDAIKMQIQLDDAMNPYTELVNKEIEIRNQIFELESRILASQNNDPQLKDTANKLEVAHKELMNIKIERWQILDFFVQINQEELQEIKTVHKKLTDCKNDIKQATDKQLKLFKQAYKKSGKPSESMAKKISIWKKESKKEESKEAEHEDKESISGAKKQ